MKQALEANWLPVGKATIEDGFWSPRLKTLFEVTLGDTFDKFERDGTLENYENLAAGRLHTHKGNPFHDGLFLETIRGASDYLTRERDPALEKRLDGYIEVIERAQMASGGGFLSTETQLERPHQRYGDRGGNLIHQHDLYNSGTLFEAGAHHYLATGKLRLLECALRCANELCDQIGEAPKEWVVPGHSLPEYALMELYELLTDRPEIAEQTSVPVRREEYRALVRFWIHGRGHHGARTNHPQYMGEYAQDHVPVHQQVQAVGHAVRATLYYTGVTRLSMLDGDEELLRDSLRLWENVEGRKLHVNGGVGATHFEEKFGTDYDLPNKAYLETCASVGLIFWAEALSRATGEARFYQVIERALYNLMLSSFTLQGDAYFYRNPLESDGSDHHWAWHSCPCCPPMIHKLFGMLDRLVYAEDGEGVLVNLLIGGALETEGATLRARTLLPWRGEYRLAVERAEKPLRVRVRVPYWAKRARFTLNGREVQPDMARGYAAMTLRAGDELALFDDMPPVRVEAHPYVRADRGRVALARGPLVYCLEGVDNHGNADVLLARDARLTVEQRPDLLGGVDVLHGDGADGARFTAVPLCVWDNRMAGAMRVWLRQDGKEDGWDANGWDGLYREYEPGV